MSSTELPLNAAGHHRSPVTMPGYHQGRPPKNKGQRFPADPPPVEEIIAVMRATSNNADGARLRALIIVLWRTGLRISEALDLAETDLDRARGALTVRKGKGGRRREWAWTGGRGGYERHRGAQSAAAQSDQDQGTSRPRTPPAS